MSSPEILKKGAITPEAFKRKLKEGNPWYTALCTAINVLAGLGLVIMPRGRNLSDLFERFLNPDEDEGEKKALSSCG